MILGTPGYGVPASCALYCAPRSVPSRTWSSWSFSPQGYRNVLSDKTEYWFDSYPEEYTTITEEFFVTQEGSFQTPAVEIESLYAPHYRANDDGREAIISKK